MSLCAWLLTTVAALAYGQPDPPPSPLQHILQQQVDAVVAHFLPTFPQIAISASWQDASRNVIVSSGTVSGRKITPADTFLFGSGTKPMTATAVLRLIDAGRIQASDKVAAIIDPYMKKFSRPPLAHYFGEAVNNATVLEVIRMSAGIPDFEDSYDFDKWVLGNKSKFWQYPYDAIAFAASADNRGGGPPLTCNPGSCSAYSSTSYEVAGLLLAAVLQPDDDWFEFDLASAVFEKRQFYPTMNFPPAERGSAKNSHAQLNRFLTVKGASVASTWENTEIYDQNPSVLGWTCGNMVASPRDVARFFLHLFDSDSLPPGEKPLLSDGSVAEMKDCKPLTTGWKAGVMKYGAGMMKLDSKWYRNVSVFGHEGDTYGFVSSQGYIPALKGAFSIVANVDSSAGEDDWPVYQMVCQLLQTVVKEIGGSSEDLGCVLAGQTTIV